jgi:ABC-type transporter Mla subunit MlaD
MAIGCVALLLMVAACKKSVEGESKRWTSANRTADELIVLYPGFKAALEEQRQKAKTAMDAAEAVSEEKQRIDKMAAANTMLTSGFVGQLRDADQTIKKIREKAIEISGKATDESDRMTARQAADQATRVVVQVEGMLKQGAPDAASAAIKLRKVTEDLRAAQDNLDRAARIAQDKQRAKESAEKAEKAPANTQQPAAEVWTCEYCDHKNPSEATACENCGAARP